MTNDSALFEYDFIALFLNQTRRVKMSVFWKWDDKIHPSQETNVFFRKPVEMTFEQLI